ncbi:hypothetical protein Syun_023158 [Stephania yunnanensis]|uniref:Uncharacterized protein n=1 Tax=Stephania yunnanensis TaxID=152371 RepID=A0AAP0FH04_9MAGN
MYLRNASLSTLYLLNFQDKQSPSLFCNQSLVKNFSNANVRFRDSAMTHFINL